MKDERQVIRWKNDAGGRSAFLKKCESLIRLRILSLLRSCIEKSHLYIDQKILFEETLKDSHSIEHYFKREDYHPNPNFNFDMEDNMEFQCQVSKKLKTRTKSYILDSQAKIDGVDEEEIFHLVGKVGDLSQNEEKKSTIPQSFPE